MMRRTLLFSLKSSKIMLVNNAIHICCLLWNLLSLWFQVRSENHAMLGHETPTYVCKLAILNAMIRTLSTSIKIFKNKNKTNIFLNRCTLFVNFLGNYDSDVIHVRAKHKDTMSKTDHTRNLIDYYKALTIPRQLWYLTFWIRAIYSIQLAL